MFVLACLSLLGSSTDGPAIAFMAIGGGVAMIAIGAAQWRGHREAAYNARLKQLMIERGMTADEIERVIQAAPPRRQRHSCGM